MYYHVMASPAQVVPDFVQLAAHPVRWRLLSELATGDYRVRELVELIGQPQNLLSYHLRLLRGGKLVSARRSSADARDTYYHLDLERCAQALTDAGAALHPALYPDPTPPPRHTGPAPAVLFTCTGNSARSPIAEALLRRHADHVEVTSAGSHPRPQLHPHAVQALNEGYGIDLTGQRPRSLATMTDRHFDYVISLCDKVREVCPDFGGRTRRIHWSIPDPAAPKAAQKDAHRAFVHTAAEIDTRVRHLLPVLTP